MPLLSLEELHLFWMNLLTGQLLVLYSINLVFIRQIERRKTCMEFDTSHWRQSQHANQGTETEAFNAKPYAWLKTIVTHISLNATSPRGTW